MKSQSTIDLMKTSNGYSIIEDDVLLNKPVINVVPQVPSISNTNMISLSVTSTMPSSTIKYPKQQKAPQILPKKFIPQQTFTIYPYIYTKPAQNRPFLIIPSRAQWFNLNSIHDIERKALPQWFKQKKGLVASVNTIKFEKNEDLYKKYRNHIIGLAKTKFVTPTMARKGLAGDACAIIRIHKFLQKWGLINFVHKKHSENLENNKDQSIQQNGVNEEKHNPAIKRKDGFDKDRTIVSKSYDKDDYELLKKITKKFRPICSCCDSLCGIHWYQYTQTLTKKSFETNEENQIVTVQSGQQFEYHIKVCFSCFVEKNYPVILGLQDFTKKTLMEQIKKIDFDNNYGKKKVQQWIRVAETVEKNKFNIGKCAEVLKIDENQLVEILVQMPIQNLEKISRIEQETDDQDLSVKELQVGQKSDNPHNLIKDKHCEMFADSNEEIKMFQQNLTGLDKEEKKLYQEFLQAWLLKMYTKLEQLEQWDKSVQWKLQQNESVKKYNIAEKLRKNLKLNDE